MFSMDFHISDSKNYSEWKKKKAHHILTEKKKVITFSRTGEKIVQDTYMVSEVCFYINSSPSTTKVFGDYTYYLPINHQSFGN